jgi:hypothetical protein
MPADSIEITGIKIADFNNDIEERIQVFLLVDYVNPNDIEFNGQYRWWIFVPKEIQDIEAYIFSFDRDKEILDAVANKVEEWRNLEDKTIVITNPITNDNFIIDLTIDEFVKPDSPDYYALRRRAYPFYGDQLDALWAGEESSLWSDMQSQIEAIKTQYPKPEEEIP